MPNSVILLSCLIPTIGRKDLVDRALRSVAEQSVSFDRVVICCDRANEELLEARKFLDQIGIDYLIVYTSGNEGGPAARFLGYQECLKGAVVLLDDDDELDKNFNLNLLKVFHQANRNIGLVLPRVKKVWTEGRIPNQFAKAPAKTSKELDEDEKENWCPSTSSGLTLNSHFFSKLPLDPKIKGFNDLQIIRNVFREDNCSVFYSKECEVTFNQYFSNFRMTSNIADRILNLEKAKLMGMKFEPDFENMVISSVIFSSWRSIAYNEGFLAFLKLLFSSIFGSDKGYTVKFSKSKLFLNIVISTWLSISRAF